MRNLGLRPTLAAAWVGVTAFAGDGDAQDLRQVTFAQPSPSALNSFPVFVAMGEGVFADEGLEVTARASASRSASSPPSSTRLGCSR